MANYLINGFSAKTGGGKAIFEDYLSFLTAASRDDQNTYFVITPNEAQYRSWNSEEIHILPVSSVYQKPIFLPLFYFFIVHRIVRLNQIDAVLNFGDVILPIHVPQVYFFDWAYAVYPESIVWKRMKLTDYFRRWAKYHIVRHTLRFATIVIAQTPTMVERLKRLYGLRKVVLVRSPVTRASMGKKVPRDFGLPAERKLLLCLANPAPHKNLEILLPLARIMKQRNDKVTVVTTLDPVRSNAAQALLTAVEKERLGEYIVNVGHVNPLHVPALFEQCHALLLPTLLESYGLPFAEAMFNQRTIITSDFDFTRDVCGEAAYYFDPLDEESI